MILTLKKINNIYYLFDKKKKYIVSHPDLLIKKLI